MLTAEEWRVAVEELEKAAGVEQAPRPGQAQQSSEPEPAKTADAEFVVRREEPAGNDDLAGVAGASPSATPTSTRSSNPDPPPAPTARLVDELPPADSSTVATDKTDIARPGRVPARGRAPDPGEAKIGEICTLLLAKMTEQPGLFLLIDDAEIDKAASLVGLARNLRAAGHVASVVPGDGLTTHDLLLDLSLRMGVPPPDSSPGWLAQFRNAASGADGRRVIVIIDDAERLTDEVLIELVEVLDVPEEKPVALRLLLTGRAPLIDRLLTPALGAVRGAVVSEWRLMRLPDGDVVARELRRPPPRTSSRSRRTRRGSVAAAAAGILLILPFSREFWIGSNEAPEQQSWIVEADAPIPTPAATPERSAAAEPAPLATADDTASAVSRPPEPIESPAEAIAAPPAETSAADTTRTPPSATVERDADDREPAVGQEPPVAAAETPSAVAEAAPAPLADNPVRSEETPPEAADSDPSGRDAGVVPRAAETAQIASASDSPAPQPEPPVAAEPPKSQFAEIAMPAPPTTTQGANPEPPAAPSTPPAAAPVPAAKLPEPVIAALVRRGDELLEIKDISAARLCYERAAAGGSVHAATLAGKTYDPAFFREIGISGMSPNPIKAAEWYRRAIAGGDAEAARRMKGLPVEFRK